MAFLLEVESGAVAPSPVTVWLVVDGVRTRRRFSVVAIDDVFPSNEVGRSRCEIVEKAFAPLVERGDLIALLQSNLWQVGEPD